LVKNRKVRETQNCRYNPVCQMTHWIVVLVQKDSDPKKKVVFHHTDIHTLVFSLPFALLLLQNNRDVEYQHIMCRYVRTVVKRDVSHSKTKLSGRMSSSRTFGNNRHTYDPLHFCIWFTLSSFDPVFM
jgi:hypothetical protein